MSYAGMRMKNITHSLDCAASNTATLLQENWVTEYSAKGKQSNDPVGNALVRKVRKFELI